MAGASASGGTAGVAGCASAQIVQNPAEDWTQAAPAGASGDTRRAPQTCPLSTEAASSSASRQTHATRARLPPLWLWLVTFLGLSWFALDRR